MKIIFMGKQKFGLSTLKKFHEETDHEIIAVYSKQDLNEKNIDPVKRYAQISNIPLFEISSFHERKIIDQIKSHDADLCLMAYVTFFLPETVRNIPKYGSICFHPSLLPLHRGPSCINWPIISGANKTGLTIFYPNNKLDEGDILLQKEININPDDTLGDVYFSKIFPLGVDSCIEAVNLIANGNAQRTPQDNSKSSYETWCKKSDAQIVWTKSGKEIYNLIRGCNPQPGAWANFKGKEYIFLDTMFENHINTEYRPGHIISVEKKFIKIAVKNGILRVSRFKSDQEKFYVKDMNTSLFSKNDFFT